MHDSEIIRENLILLLTLFNNNQSAFMAATQVDQSSISKVLHRKEGRTLSRQAQQRIERALHLPVGWFQEKRTALDLPRRESTAPTPFVPYLGYIDIGRWLNARSPYETPGFELIACPHHGASPFTFAIPVRGADVAPPLQLNDIIFIDPKIKLADGCIVLIRLVNTYCVRQYIDKTKLGTPFFTNLRTQEEIAYENAQLVGVAIATYHALV